jgi:hypothetical protein
MGSNLISGVDEYRLVVAAYSCGKISGYTILRCGMAEVSDYAVG